MKKKITLGAVLLAIVAIIYFGSTTLINKNNVPENNERLDALERELDFGSNQATEATVEAMPGDNNFVFYQGQAISLLAERIPSDIPKTVVEKYEKELERLEGLLVEDPLQVDVWTGVGIIKKTFENYEGARDAFEYAKYLNDENAFIYYDLGELYARYLKDVDRAEENFKKAIEIEKNNSAFYIGVADFYRYFHTAKRAEAGVILEQGFVVLPKDVSLLTYAASFYKEEGDFTKALEYFERALELEPGNEAVREEVVNLSK